MKIQHLVYLNDTTFLQKYITSLVSLVEECIESENSLRRVQFSTNPVLPKRWGGYVIPLHLADITENSIKMCIPELDKVLTSEVLDDIAWSMYKDSKKRPVVEFHVAVVEHYKHSRMPGILFFWER